MINTEIEASHNLHKQLKIVCFITKVQYQQYTGNLDGTLLQVLVVEVLESLMPSPRYVGGQGSWNKQEPMWYNVAVAFDYQNTHS